MLSKHLARVLDRAKVYKRQPHDLAHVGDQAAAIGTVAAMKFFDEIEVFKLLPVKHDVVPAAHLGDPVDWKTGGLIEAHKQVQKGQRNNHCLLYTSPSPRDGLLSRMPSSA